MGQRLGEGAIGHQRVQAAGHQQPELQRIQLQYLRRRRPGREQQRATQVDHHHHLEGRPFIQQLFLRQPVSHPHHRRQHHRQHAQGVFAQRRQQLAESLVEEQPEAQQQHQQAQELGNAEGLAEHEQAADQQQERGDLDHQLCGSRTEHVQPHQVEHVVADQPGDGQHHQRPAPAAQRTEGRQPAAPAQPDQQDQTGAEQPVPGDGDRVHDLEHQLELDRQDSPENGRDHGQGQAEEPAARRNVHAYLCRRDSNE